MKDWKTIIGEPKHFAIGDYRLIITPPGPVSFDITKQNDTLVLLPFGMPEAETSRVQGERVDLANNKGAMNIHSAGTDVQLSGTNTSPKIVIELKRSTFEDFTNGAKIGERPYAAVTNEASSALGYQILAGAVSDTANSLYLEGLCTALVAMAAPEITGKTGPKPNEAGSDKRIARSLDFIEANLHGTLTVSRIARTVGMSVSHFQVCFSVETGDTVAVYVKKRRLLRAYRLLQNGKMTVGDVAAEAGFVDASHLGKIFKAEYGITPGQFMRL